MVDLDQTVYEVVEDSEGVEICVNLSGPSIEQSLIVFLQTSEDTAQCMRRALLVFGLHSQTHFFLHSQRLQWW